MAGLPRDSRFRTYIMLPTPNIAHLDYEHVYEPAGV